MLKSLYPVLANLPDSAARNAAISAAAEGYSFPTNLDRDPPIGGMAPQTQAQLVATALNGSWDVAQFETALDAQTQRRMP